MTAFLSNVTTTLLITEADWIVGVSSLFVVSAQKEYAALFCSLYTKESNMEIVCYIVSNLLPSVGKLAKSQICEFRGSNPWMISPKRPFARSADEFTLLYRNIRYTGGSRIEIYFYPKPWWRKDSPSVPRFCELYELGSCPRFAWKYPRALCLGDTHQSGHYR